MNRTIRLSLEWMLLLILGLLLLGSCNLLKGKGAGGNTEEGSSAAGGGGASRAEGSLGDGSGSGGGEEEAAGEASETGGAAAEGESSEASGDSGAEGAEEGSSEGDGSAGGEDAGAGDDSGEGGEGEGSDSGAGEGEGGSEGDGGEEAEAEDDLSDIKGREVYMESNCQMCHGVKLTDGKLGPPLDNIGKYWNEDDLMDFMKNPQKADERYPRIKQLKDSGKYVMEMSPITETDERRIRALARWLIDET